MDDQAADLLRSYLQTLGLDEERDPQLAATPERVTEMLKELFSGLHESPPKPSTFPATDGDAAESDPVVIAALPFQSMCVHHLLPFFGTVDVAYLPGDELVGFGSVGRIVDHFARRPQVQERMIAQIADYIEESIAPDGLLVRLRARQLCMEMRGAKKSGDLISIAGRGCLVDGPRRSELLRQFDCAEKPL